MNKQAKVEEKDSYMDLFVLRQECGAAFVWNCWWIIVNTHAHLCTFGHLLKILLYIYSCRIQRYFYIQHLNHICPIQEEKTWNN